MRPLRDFGIAKLRGRARIRWSILFHDSKAVVVETNELCIVTSDNRFHITSGCLRE